MGENLDENNERLRRANLRVVQATRHKRKFKTEIKGFIEKTTDDTAKVFVTVSSIR